MSNFILILCLLSICMVLIVISYYQNKFNKEVILTLEEITRHLTKDNKSIVKMMPEEQRIPIDSYNDEESTDPIDESNPEGEEGND